MNRKEEQVTCKHWLYYITKKFEKEAIENYGIGAKDGTSKITLYENPEEHWFPNCIIYRTRATGHKKSMEKLKEFDEITFTGHIPPGKLRRYYMSKRQLADAEENYKKRHALETITSPIEDGIPVFDN